MNADRTTVPTATALSDILALQQLKAQYCRHLDGKDWQAWRDVFAGDFVMDLSEAGGPVIEGEYPGAFADTFRQWFLNRGGHD
jgi:hypothetical protein